MMSRPKRITVLTILCASLFLAACSQNKVEDPFGYSFIKERRIKRGSGKPYSEYKAFYLLTEDFEPRVQSPGDVEQIREVLRFAGELSATYNIPWTHFVDANALAPAMISDDARLKEKCRELIADLKLMTGKGDDCELHLHGMLNRELLDLLKAEHKLRVKPSGAEDVQGYRQRKSFFFHSFYAAGYREMVTSLTYGKSFLEQVIYDGGQPVLAFRPGGWDHGSSSQDTLLYYSALIESGLTANSGLVTGRFGTQNWRVGNYPGHNLAAVELRDKSITEISPTSGPGGYVNPVLPNDLLKLAGSVSDEMAVIMSVYHLGSLQPEQSEADDRIQNERHVLESHFKTVADLVSKKVLYPVTIRQLLAILSEA